MKNLKTIIAHDNKDKYGGAVTAPIFQSSLFTFDSYEGISEAFDDPYMNPIYSRGNNPTVRILEEKVAAAAGAENCKFFSSGMAAITSAILHYVSSGDHIVAISNTYGPANNFLNLYLKKKFKVDVTFVKGDKIEDFKEAMRDNTKLFYLESPSSALFNIQDLRAVADLAKANNINTIIDNSWATFIYQKPLELGIDMEVHSASKYLSGHSDVVAGCILGRDEDIRAIYGAEFPYFGGVLSPFDAWLVLRGFRTLPLRLEQHSKSAMEVARYLETHPKIKKVNYVGLESFEGHEMAKKQMSGFAGLMSFDIDTDVAGVKKFMNALEIFSIGVSWGGYESLAFAPIISLLKETPEEVIKEMGVSPGVVRISVGLEGVEDLIHDIDKALELV